MQLSVTQYAKQIKEKRLPKGVTAKKIGNIWVINKRKS